MAHYRATPETDAQITRNDMYLIDSGGQYLDGTTDITRTIHLGEPNAEQKEAFTRVLKGFISLARAVFPPHAPVSASVLYTTDSINNENTSSFPFSTLWLDGRCGMLDWTMGMERDMV